MERAFCHSSYSKQLGPSFAVKKGAFPARGSSRSPEVMALIRMLYFCAAKFDINVMIAHTAGSSNETADTLSHFQATRFQQLAPLAEPQPDITLHGQPSSGRLLHEYQSLGVALLLIEHDQLEVEILQPIQHPAIPCFIIYIVLLLYLHCTLCILQDNQNLFGWDTPGTL